MLHKKLKLCCYVGRFVILDFRTKTWSKSFNHQSTYNWNKQLQFNKTTSSPINTAICIQTQLNSYQKPEVLRAPSWYNCSLSYQEYTPPPTSDIHTIPTRRASLSACSSSSRSAVCSSALVGSAYVAILRRNFLELAGGGTHCWAFAIANLLGSHSSLPSPPGIGSSEHDTREPPEPVGGAVARSSEERLATKKYYFCFIWQCLQIRLSNKRIISWRQPLRLGPRCDLTWRTWGTCGTRIGRCRVILKRKSVCVSICIS